MPSDFPRFPERDGAPGDGALAVYADAGGGNELAFGGLVEHLEAIDARSFTGLALAAFEGRFGQPLHGDATTIWMRGVLHVDQFGLPQTESYADAIDAWLALRARLFTAGGWRLYFYSRTSPETLRLRYDDLKTVFLHSRWQSNVSVGYTLGAYTTDRTLTKEA